MAEGCEGSEGSTGKKVSTGRISGPFISVQPLGVHRWHAPRYREKKSARPTGAELGDEVYDGLLERHPHDPPDLIAAIRAVVVGGEDEQGDEHREDDEDEDERPENGVERGAEELCLGQLLVLERHPRGDVDEHLYVVMAYAVMALWQDIRRRQEAVPVYS